MIALSCGILASLFLGSCTTPNTRWSDGSTAILVFSKTEGYRHKSIADGRDALSALGYDAGYTVVLSEDATVFNEDQLAGFAAVVFLNTSGDVLGRAQQEAFENYIRSGGGFVGVHADADTEYDWPWFGELVGARFDIHPDIQVDEASYSGGTNGEHHPVAWYREFGGGRAFYTAMGHTKDSYQEPLFLNHLAGGLAWAIGDDNALLVMPKKSKFKREVLDFDLDEPMELDEIPGEGIVFIERRGSIKFYDFAEKETRLLAELDVFYGNEDGLLGLAVDPDYRTNHWVYLFYTAPLEQSLQRVSRFTLESGALALDSEIILLEIPTDRFCCHSGGGLEFGENRQLYIGVGDNTNPFESDGFAPIDERLERALWDAQRSAANSMDMRGKILRITVEDDGTYSIPEGNLFPRGAAQTRPEIYVMGCRNPFRFTIDSVSGDLIWGDIGPDAGRDNPARGPMGMGEFNRANTAGNWGWPYSRGDNQAYVDYDFGSEQGGEQFDPASPVNDSPNNTGIRRLPSSRASFVWYSYGVQPEFPWLGSGGVNPMVGPVFYRQNFADSVNTFPEYFEGGIFLYEWMRDWVAVGHFDKMGKKLRRVEPFMPGEEFSHPMDMMFATDGSLYLLEYGQKWNQRNLDARLNRISYFADGVLDLSRVSAGKSREHIDKPAGQRLIEASDCRGCHGIEALVNGPSYKQIAERYGVTDRDYLADKIIEGGAGAWGERHMPPHPQVPLSDVEQMVGWILSLNPANQLREHGRRH